MSSPSVGVRFSSVLLFSFAFHLTLVIWQEQAIRLDAPRKQLKVHRIPQHQYRSNKPTDRQIVHLSRSETESRTLHAMILNYKYNKFIAEICACIMYVVSTLDDKSYNVPDVCMSVVGGTRQCCKINEHFLIESNLNPPAPTPH